MKLKSLKKVEWRQTLSNKCKYESCYTNQKHNLGVIYVLKQELD
jgi:hypothetical protein